MVSPSRRNPRQMDQRARSAFRRAEMLHHRARRDADGQSRRTGQSQRMVAPVDEIEAGAMASPMMTRSDTRRQCGEQRHLGLGPGWPSRSARRINAQEAVGLRKRRDCTRASAGGDKRCRPSPSSRRRTCADHHRPSSVRPSSEAMRTGTVSAHLGIGARRRIRPSCAAPASIMSWKSEHRRGRAKPGRITTRLAVAYPQDRAACTGTRSATPMRVDDTGLPEPADDAMGKVARAFERTARQHQHVGINQRAAHESLRFCFIVRNGRRGRLPRRRSRRPPRA